MPEAAEKGLDVGLQFAVGPLVGQSFCSRALHPLGVMNPGAGSRLRAGLRQGIPNAVKNDEDNREVMAAGGAEELVHPVEKSSRVLLPGEVVEEDAQGIETQILGPGQFTVDLLEIEGIRLPHFELIDRVGGNIIAPDRPGPLLHPGLGFFRGPARPGAVGAAGKTGRWQHDRHG